MKKLIFLCDNQDSFATLSGYLCNGYVLDPQFDSKPLRMENAIAFPLILYESEEERPKPVEEAQKIGEFDEVESLRDVPHGEVDGLLREGYVIHQIFSKNTVLLKRAAVKEAA